METTSSIALVSPTFYESLRSCVKLDLRDNRGKRHDLALVLLSVLLALLRHRDGNLSSIHRAMVNTHAELVAYLGISTSSVVSRAQLPLILKKVSIAVLDALIFQYFGVTLSESAKKWFAIDGKELRGSIEVGHTRGEAIVQVVRHCDKQVLTQAYYNGSKDSEIPVVQAMLRATPLSRQQLTMDALHFNPKNLGNIAHAGGKYLIGLKGNQQEMFADMTQYSKLLNCEYQLATQQKGHGRMVTHLYKAFDISKEYFDKRWKLANFSTLIQVKRTRFITNTQKYSEETAYYMSNEVVKGQGQTKANELFKVIPNHWAIETNNNIRDTVLKEDAMTTLIKEVNQTFSLLRTLTIKILQTLKPKNMVAQLDAFADNFKLLLSTLNAVNIL